MRSPHRLPAPLTPMPPGKRFSAAALAQSFSARSSEHAGCYEIGAPAAVGMSGHRAHGRPAMLTAGLGQAARAAAAAFACQQQPASSLKSTALPAS